MFVYSGSAQTSRTMQCLITALRLAVFAFVVSTLICWPAISRSVGAQEDAPSLSLLGDPLKLKIEKDEETIPAEVTVFNNSNQRTALDFSAVLRDSEGGELDETEVQSPGSTNVDPYSIVQVDLAFDKAQFEGRPMPLKGFLKVSGTQTASGGESKVVPGTLALTLSESKTFPSILGLPPLLWVIGFPLMLALFWVFVISSFGVVVDTIRGNKDKVRLGSTIGTGLTPSLSFGEKASWASMITVVAAIFTAFTTAAIYPEERPYFSKEEMAGFVLFFVVLVAFAPVVYNLARRDKSVVAKDNAAGIAKEPQVQGYVWTFLTASALVLGALLGELLVAGLLTFQFGTAMASLTKWLLRVVLLISAIYAVVYVHRGVRLQLNEKTEKKEHLARARAARQNTIQDEINRDQLGERMPITAEGYRTNEETLSMP